VDLWPGIAVIPSFSGRLTSRGLELMRRYISRGHLVDSDIDDVRDLYPDEPEPLWQSRTPSPPKPLMRIPTGKCAAPQLQNELWQFERGPCGAGSNRFLNVAVAIAQRGITGGCCVFPRRQPIGWQRRLRLPFAVLGPVFHLPTWHPMSYAVCGNTGCILDDIRRVFSMAGPGAENYVVPAIAGIWGQSTYNRPALETDGRPSAGGCPRSMPLATLPIPGRIRSLTESGSFALCNRHGLTGQPAGSPGILKVEPAGNAVNVQNFSCKVQAQGRGGFPWF
jgi:hypothetical protein